MLKSILIALFAAATATAAEQSCSEDSDCTIRKRMSCGYVLFNGKMKENNACIDWVTCNNKRNMGGYQYKCPSRPGYESLVVMI